MKKRIEYVLQLPWKIEGDRFYFHAEDDLDAAEIVQEMLHCVKDICEHKNFNGGICTECGLECEHDDVEENHCVLCQAFIEPGDPREEPEYLEER